MMSSGTGTRRTVGVRLRIAAAVLAVVAAVLGFGPASGTSRAATASPAAASSASSSGQTLCAPSGDGGTTCTNTFSGDTAWDLFLGGAVDPNTGLPPGGMTGLAPSVTVDQTSNLTNQIVQVSWKNFTPSMNSDFVSGYQYGQEVYGVGVFQCKGAAPTDFDAQCNHLILGTPTTGAPATGVESYTLAGTSTQQTDCSLVPATDTVCGTGYTDMQIQTAVQNPSLGCSSTSACSIVVLPFWGGNLQSPANCEDHSQDLPGGTDGYAADSTDPWNSPCTWADRITIPLSFAPTPTQYCPVGQQSFSAQGSPMLERVMDQWEPGWCDSTQGKVDLDYDSGVNEYEARQGFLGTNSALSASTDVALVTDPASSAATSASSREFTYAPIVTSSITIAFYVDNEVTEEPITSLKLDARLVAKLLTQSYALAFGQCSGTETTETDLCDNAVEDNPVSIFADPEFYQLNPEYSEADFLQKTSGENASGDFLPIVLAGNSDMTYELTRWVESDPDARAFLQGEPDPWGMHVNANYKQGVSQTYPISDFETLDPGFTATLSQLTDSTEFPFLSTMQVSWNPVTGLDNVASDLANWTPSGDTFPPSCSTNPLIEWTQCNGEIINAKDPLDQFPQRALFAIVDSGTAAAYRFPTASLINPAGNAVAPTTDSMSAAVGAMKTNPDGITQYQDFADTSANAYPLTEVEYAMVPTCGLSPSKAQAISTLINDVAASQDYGPEVGEIPPFGGYLALDPAQQAQDATAATAVENQTCKSPPGDTSVSGGKPPTSNGSGPGNPSSNNLGGSPNTVPTVPSTAPSNAPYPTGKASASPSAKPTPIGLGEKAADSSSDMRFILPVALVAGALLAIGGPLAYGLGTAGGLSLPWRRGKRGPGGGSDG